MTKVKTDKSAIDWFLDHGVEHIYPTREALKEKMLSGERLTIYLGIDPTGPTLHLGHALNMQKLRELQDLGHKIILLIGDFTAMIGDPTDKLAARKQQTREEVLEHCKVYKKQAARLLDFNGPNAAEITFNSRWLAKMSFEDVVHLAAHFTVQQMMERDMFEQRIENGVPVHLHEFLYPLMQGYDSVAMDVDMEIGGNDQTFNMLAGRTLMKEMKSKEKFVVTQRLLSDSTGKKMGKTEGTIISFDDEPKNVYGKVMSWTDEMIIPGFEICTQRTKKEIDAIKKKMEAGENPMTFKRELASDIVAWLCGADQVAAASAAFSRVHQEGERPETMLEFFVTTPSISLADALVLSKFVTSKTEARRQIQQGAIKVNDEKSTDPNAIIDLTDSVVIQKGKRFFAKFIHNI